MMRPKSQNRLQTLCLERNRLQNLLKIVRIHLRTIQETQLRSINRAHPHHRKELEIQFVVEEAVE